ncbi:MAG: hypothetical protein ACRD1X_01580 [Vicinamibacteria bacterium]
MRRTAVIILFLISNGCQPNQEQTENTGARNRSMPSNVSQAAPDLLVNRVWTGTDAGGPPGVLRIFLANGTMVLDSCWETYQLVEWRMVTNTSLVWREGTIDVPAEILVLNSDELVLRLDLRGGSEELHYQAPSVPYLCPDIPR